MFTVFIEQYVGRFQVSVHYMAPGWRSDILNTHIESGFKKGGRGGKA